MQKYFFRIFLIFIILLTFYLLVGNYFLHIKKSIQHNFISNISFTFLIVGYWHYSYVINKYINYYKNYQVFPISYFQNIHQRLFLLLTKGGFMVFLLPLPIFFSQNHFLQNIIYVITEYFFIYSIFIFAFSFWDILEKYKLEKHTLTLYMLPLFIPTIYLDDSISFYFLMFVEFSVSLFLLFLVFIFSKLLRR